MKTGAEAGMVWSQAQGRLEPPEAGRGRKDPPLETLEGVPPTPSLTSDFRPPGLCESTFLLFQAPGLWSFVRAALGDSHTH